MKENFHKKAVENIFQHQMNYFSNLFYTLVIIIKH